MIWIAHAKCEKSKNLFKTWVGKPHPKKRRFSEEDRPVKLGNSRTLVFPDTLASAVLLWRAKATYREGLLVYRAEEVGWKEPRQREREFLGIAEE